MTGARPAIHELGNVRDDGTTVTVSGWTLGTCASHCRCHANAAGGLAIASGDDGSLGLVSYWRCGCCAPWSVAELQAVLRDAEGLHVIVDGQALETAG